MREFVFSVLEAKGIIRGLIDGRPGQLPSSVEVSSAEWPFEGQYDFISESVTIRRREGPIGVVTVEPIDSPGFEVSNGQIVSARWLGYMRVFGACAHAFLRLEYHEANG